MASDFASERAVSLELWKGFVPAIISLANADVTSVSRPHDIYVC